MYVYVCMYVRVSNFVAWRNLKRDSEITQAYFILDLVIINPFRDRHVVESGRRSRRRLLLLFLSLTAVITLEILSTARSSLTLLETTYWAGKNETKGARHLSPVLFADYVAKDRRVAAE